MNILTNEIKLSKDILNIINSYLISSNEQNMEKLNKFLIRYREQNDNGFFEIWFPSILKWLQDYTFD